jgi:thiamine-phosphate pyrophosphorylase
MSVVDAARALSDAGARVLQFRWKQHFGRAAFEQAEIVADICRQAGTTLVVNDRADIAVLLGAGVHLGQDDLPPKLVRDSLTRLWAVGLSTHNEGQFLAALSEPVDYVALGPIYGTSNKIGADPVVGLNLLARLCPQSDRPVVAIGGINRLTAPAVWRAGADSVAVIGDMYPQRCTAASVKERFEEWSRIASGE